MSAAELSATVDAIAAGRCPAASSSGILGGHSDPWNHVEAAMALAVGGRLSDAERAYDWLVSHQLENGAWYNYYLADGIEDLKLDTNVCAYVAAGVWHHYLLTCDRGFLDTCGRWSSGPSTSCSRCRPRGGEIIWARHTDGTPWSYALLTGSSSIATACGARWRSPSPSARNDLTGSSPPQTWPTSSRTCVTLRAEGPLGDGLVLPGARRRRHRRRRGQLGSPSARRPS